MQENDLIYYLELSARGCMIRIIINGLILADVDATFAAGFGSPINDNLVGENNVLKIIALSGVLGSGEFTKVSDVLVRGAIKIYKVGDISGPESGSIVKRFDFYDVISKRQKDIDFGDTVSDIDDMDDTLGITFPLELEIGFDNQIFNFRDRFLESEVIEDKEKLLDYAEFLRDLMKNRDANKLYREFKPKFDDYNTAYPHYANNDEILFPAFLNEEFFPGGPITDFKRDDIGLESWCEGRVWEIFVRPHQHFFMTAGLNDQVNKIEIFVGKVDGELKVIR